MSKSWSVALLLGAAGSVSLAASVRHLYLRTVALREAMRPLRVQRRGSQTD
ncbi:MAG TPA: hypothetical protein VFZ97_00330 [Acidimicrobiales bacterium]